MVKQINDGNFKNEVGSGISVVDFWAPWCGPCKMIGPVIEEIAKEYADKVNFAKVNVDDNPVTATQYSVSSIPTIMIFKDGKLQDTMVGFRPKEILKAMIEKHI